MTLLGQNVNSYRDVSEMSKAMHKEPPSMAKGKDTDNQRVCSKMSKPVGCFLGLIRTYIYCHREL